MPNYSSFDLSIDAALGISAKSYRALSNFIISHNSSTQSFALNVNECSSNRKLARQEEADFLTDSNQIFADEWLSQEDEAAFANLQK
jgi:hypothetical protein